MNGPLRRAVPSRLVTAVLVIGFAGGIALRMLTVSSMGTDDMNYMIRWGQDVLNRGLADGYAGSYFPFHYQIFAFGMWIARTFHWTPVESLKVVDLVFDIGSFALILALLKRFNANPLYALLYWLHPWFLLIFSFGYCDPQFTFFILLSIWLLALDPARTHTALAGGAIAAAALMKPQGIVPAAGLMLYVRLRDRRPLNALIFLAPIVMWFGAYELYFAANHSSSARDAILYLPRSYVGASRVMPVLTANMLNAWYPVAFALKSPGAGIWTVGSRIELLPHVRLDVLIGAVVSMLVASYAVVLTREPSQSTGPLRLMTFAALVVPFFMTGAHENHLFLGTALLAIVMAISPSGAGRAAFHGILAIEAINLELLYGSDRLAAWARPAYSYEWRVILSVISVALCLMIMKQVHGARDAEAIGFRSEVAV
jgi:hypothetical protein